MSDGHAIDIDGPAQEEALTKSREYDLAVDEILNQVISLVEKKTGKIVPIRHIEDTKVGIESMVHCLEDRAKRWR